MIGFSFIEEYRYGFQGQEKDDEIKNEGNSYDFGARIYDPRVGRWLSLDPRSQDYPSYSDYCFVLNTPIQAKDPDGEVVIFINGLDNSIFSVMMAIVPTPHWTDYMGGKSYYAQVGKGAYKFSEDAPPSSGADIGKVLM